MLADDSLVEVAADLVSARLFGPPSGGEISRNGKGLCEAAGPFRKRVWGGFGDPYARLRRKPRWWRRVPPPRTAACKSSWLRGRRRNIGPLVMLFEAAALLSRGPSRRNTLCRLSRDRSHAPAFPPYWTPSDQVFLTWLLHHQIAVKAGRDEYVAGPAAQQEFNMASQLGCGSSMLGY